MQALINACPLDGEIVDIGGSRLNLKYHNELHAAFAKQGDFPKEIAYLVGMETWVKALPKSFQTVDEIGFMEQNANSVVKDLPDDTKIIDLGAAMSPKVMPYLDKFHEKGKKVTYYALDICYESLSMHLCIMKNIFPTVTCIGLWGSFSDGHEYYHNITGTRLFLSLGSSMFNAPESVVHERCKLFKKQLNASDRLIVGQDVPMTAASDVPHTFYHTREFNAFLIRYIHGLHAHARIMNSTNDWTVQSFMGDKVHHFLATAQMDMKCTNLDFEIKKGTQYVLFPDYKRTGNDIRRFAKAHGLYVSNKGKRVDSTMRQYLFRLEY